MSTAWTSTVQRIAARRLLRKRENASVCEENLGRHAAIVADSGQSATVLQLLSVEPLFAWLLFV
jgi:hypothetical protein